MSTYKRTRQAYLMLGIPLIAGLALAAFLIWIAYLLILAIILGLQLLVNTFQQLSSLISGTPVLHFLFILALTCLIVAIVKWMLIKTYRFVMRGQQHGRI